MTGMEHYGYGELDHDDWSWDAGDLLDHGDLAYADPGNVYDDPLLPYPEHECESGVIEFVLPSTTPQTDVTANEAAGLPHPEVAELGQAGGWDLPDDLLGEGYEIGAGTFDPALDAVIVGDPVHDMGFWHEQQSDDTCAIAAQDFVIESLTGRDVSERELFLEAERNGWYVPGEGTTSADMDRLVASYGIPVEEHALGSIGELETDLAEGDKVIVGVNGEELWQLDPPGAFPAPDHAVEVIGVVDTPSGEMVVLNDSGTPDGAGEMVPLERFLDAWSTSEDLVVDAGPGAAR